MCKVGPFAACPMAERGSETDPRRAVVIAKPGQFEIEVDVAGRGVVGGRVAWLQAHHVVDVKGACRGFLIDAHLAITWGATKVLNLKSWTSVPGSLVK